MSEEKWTWVRGPEARLSRRANAWCGRERGHTIPREACAVHINGHYETTIRDGSMEVRFKSHSSWVIEVLAREWLSGPGEAHPDPWGKPHRSKEHIVRKVTLVEVGDIVPLTDSEVADFFQDYVM